ncbi:methionyl-tRNA formyltransferase, mitochondrial-like [Liolophura sinensis]|uniref:methionyl-tRNA formyltransferase, mitochondrial-like n=1 Tax=Liolophura sinensis TaxID=3198878 RepID=UPI0031589D3F
MVMRLRFEKRLRTLQSSVQLCGVCCNKLTTKHLFSRISLSQGGRRRCLVIHIGNISSSQKNFPASQENGVDRKFPNVKAERQKPPWRILFFGTDDFSLHTLKVLHSNRQQLDYKLVDTLEVVTKQKCSVRRFAEVTGLVTHDWPISITPEKFDVGVLVSFGKLIPSKVINKFAYGILNIHPSLLPRWRGAAPIPHTVLNGDQETGVSIMQILPTRFDQGPIVKQVKLPVPPGCTTLELAQGLGEKGSQMILEVLSDLVSHLDNRVQQSTEGVTLAHKLSRTMAYINWESQTCQQIDQQYRALHELLPLRTEWNGKAVKLLDMIITEDDVETAAEVFFKTKHFSPGQPFYRKKSNKLYIRCKDGWVGFKSLILKKPMTAQDFDCGYLSKTLTYPDMKFTSVKNGLFQKDS